MHSVDRVFTANPEENYSTRVAHRLSRILNNNAGRPCDRVGGRRRILETEERTMDWLLIWFVFANGDVASVQLEFETERLCRQAMATVQKDPPLGEAKNKTAYCLQVREYADRKEITLPQR